MTNKSNKGQVSFYDEQLENVYFEYSILRRKLQSKVEALMIMNKELNTCRIERDQYKLIAEQVQSLKITPSRDSSSNFVGNLNYDERISTSVKMLNDLREENKSLTIEIGRLKQRLSDRDGDIKFLRQRLLSQKEAESISKSNLSFTNHDREELIKQLEVLNEKIKNLKSDLRTVIDEKEELISEKEAYKCKIYRLNHELKVLMCGDKEHIEELDIDSLIMENKCLTDRLAKLETEKELMNQGLLKYKSMLETTRKKSDFKLEIAENETILTQEQVAYLFENKLTKDSSISSSKLAEIKKFCYGIMEALNDRTLALAHQKKANKILASRISDLEQKIEPHRNGDMHNKITPSHIFLQNYHPAKVIDKSFDVLLDEELKKYEEPKTEVNVEEQIIKNHEIKNGVTNGSSSTDLKLPPNLEILLKQAVDEIKSERALKSSIIN